MHVVCITQLPAYAIGYGNCMTAPSVVGLETRLHAVCSLLSSVKGYIVQGKLKKMCAGRRALVSSAGSTWWFSATSVVKAVSSILEATSACARTGVDVHVIHGLRKAGRRCSCDVGARGNILHVDVEESAISLLMELVLVQQRRSSPEH